MSVKKNVEIQHKIKLNPKLASSLRCMQWLKNQNSPSNKKVLQSKNDVLFVQSNKFEKPEFSNLDIEDTIPDGVNESVIKPKTVTTKFLRISKLSLACEWQGCKLLTNNYESYQKHVIAHFSDVIQIIDKEETVMYSCLWDVCGHKTKDYNEMFRHLNYHAYHGKLLAIGLNGRATLKLERCKKNSTKRNQLPNLPNEHICMWTDCNRKFNSIQILFDHAKLHVNYSEKFLCSWAGCGAWFTTKALLGAHVRSHTGERLIACYHCGQHFANNRKLRDHLRRQNVDPESPFKCTMCGIPCATEYLLNEHARQHVSAHVCALCDMTATSPAALAQHVRYRHLPRAPHHACTRCAYRAVTKNDLQKHLMIHDKKRNKKKSDRESDRDSDLSDNSIITTKKKKKKKIPRKYACHMCPEDKMKMFARGNTLTSHLVKVHGVQWPYGHSRFRYQKSEDGVYRLTTTRYEVLEVSNKIFARDSGPKQSLNENLDFKLKQVAEPTFDTPRRFEIMLLGGEGERGHGGVEESRDSGLVEITMCDVDDKGNVIKSELIESQVI